LPKGDALKKAGLKNINKPEAQHELGAETGQKGQRRDVVSPRRKSLVGQKSRAQAAVQSPIIASFVCLSVRENAFLHTT